MLTQKIHKTHQTSSTHFGKFSKMSCTEAIWLSENLYLLPVDVDMSGGVNFDKTSTIGTQQMSCLAGQ